MAEKRARKAEKKAQKGREREGFQDDLATVLGTPEGRRVLQAVIDMGHLYDYRWSPSVQFHVREGYREMALGVRQMIESVDERLPIVMEAEKRERKVDDGRNFMLASLNPLWDKILRERGK